MTDQNWFVVHTLDNDELTLSLSEVQGFGSKTHIQNVRAHVGTVVYAVGQEFHISETLDQLKALMKNAGPIDLTPSQKAPVVAPKVGGATVRTNPIAPNTPPAPPKAPAQGTTTTSGQMLDNMKNLAEGKTKAQDPVAGEFDKA